MGSLSNNSIESLYQDRTGKLWIGTCDGINIFNGRVIEIYQPKDRNNALLGNIIDNMIETDENILWIQTYYGLNKLDKNTNQVSHYTDFNPHLYLTKDKQNTLFVLQEDNFIHYYDAQKDTFNIAALSGINIQNILQVTIDKDNKLWIICKDGNFISYSIIHKEEELFLVETYRSKRFDSLLYAFCSSNDILCVDEQKQLYSFNLHSLSQDYLCSLKEMINKKGEISSILRSGENIYVGYKTNGLQVLKKLNSGYEVEDISINCGVFSLWKDRYQDIIWIGTDGQGVYSYSNDTYSIKTINIKDYIPHIGKPIRSIYKDEHRTLWIGTKGDGIIKVKDYEESEGLSTAKIENLTMNNSMLKDNAVYCIRKSEKKQILWIGTENGLNYFSYTENKIKPIKLTIREKPIIYIHDIYEQDSILWISTVGMGVIKAKIIWENNQPTLQAIDELVMDGGNMPANYFFAIYPLNDTTLWLANRGLGAIKLDTQSMDYEQVRFSKSNRKTLDEILSINRIENNMYFGTSAGLVEYSDAEHYDIFDNNDGFLNNTIHDILKEDDNSLWLSTNRGLINYKPKDKIVRSYNADNGLGIAEYSDGAAFFDEALGVLYFGGIDGFVSITRHRDYSYEYMPNLTFEHLTILGEDKNIKDYIKDGVIELKHFENFITIEVNAIDYINTHNYSFFYKIDEVSNQWIDNGSSTVIPITNLNHGKYTLSVKYINKNIDSSSIPHTLKIRVLPPWYLSPIAYAIYIIIFITCIILLYKYLEFIREKETLLFKKIRIKTQGRNS